MVFDALPAAGRHARSRLALPAAGRHALSCFDGRSARRAEGTGQDNRTPVSLLLHVWPYDREIVWLFYMGSNLAAFSSSALRAA